MDLAGGLLQGSVVGVWGGDQPSWLRRGEVAGGRLQGSGVGGGGGDRPSWVRGGGSSKDVFFVLFNRSNLYV